jgi:hypothetical protein
MVSLDSSCQRPGASVTKQQPISLLHEVLDGSGLVLALADATTAPRRFYQLVGDLYRLLGARCHADCLRLPAAVRRVALHAPDGSLAPSPAPKPPCLSRSPIATALIDTIVLSIRSDASALIALSHELGGAICPAK